MVNTTSSTFILAIPGTQETQELPREAVLEGIQRGEIGPDHWVWSPTHNDWKHVAEIPELQVPPAVAPNSANPEVPVAMSAHFPPASQQAAPEPEMVVTPVFNAPVQLAPTRYSQPMEIKHEFPIFKVLFFILFLAVASILAANYYMVDQPFAANFSTTSFGTVPVYAHLGAFTQPGALVIHVPPTKEINADNFADFLVALAKSTPLQPLNQQPFNGVGLTSAWQSQYIFTGDDWQKLGQMTSASSDEKKKFAIDHIEQIDGTGLVNRRKNETPILTESENKAWQSLVTNFTSKTP